MSDNITQECLDNIEQTLQELEGNERDILLEQILLNFWPNYKQKTENCGLLIENFKLALKKVSQKEHQSGLYRALVASVCGDNINNTQIANTLEITRKAVGKAKRQRLDWDNGAEEYNSLLQKPHITRQKMDPQITECIIKWMEHAFTPSSNSNNVIKKKGKDGQVEYMVKHWRTETFKELMASYLSFNPYHRGAFGRNYFIGLVPWYV